MSAATDYRAARDVVTFHERQSRHAIDAARPFIIVTDQGWPDDLDEAVLAALALRTVSPAARAEVAVGFILEHVEQEALAPVDDEAFVCDECGTRVDDDGLICSETTTSWCADHRDTHETACVDCRVINAEDASLDWDARWGR